MKTTELNRKEAIDRIVRESEIGNDCRFLVGYTNRKDGRFLYLDSSGQVFPAEYVGEHTFRLIDLMLEPFTWDGSENSGDEGSDDDFWKNYEDAEEAAKNEVDAELLDEYKHDSLIDPNGEDVSIIWV